MVVHQLLDQGLRLCLDCNQECSTVLYLTVDVGISSVSVLVFQDVPAWYIDYLCLYQITFRNFQLSTSSVKVYLSE